MKTATARQVANAAYSAAAGHGKPAWVVRSHYGNAASFATSKPMTYREALAQARAVREAAGYASVERAA